MEPFDQFAGAVLGEAMREREAYVLIAPGSITLQRDCAATGQSKYARRVPLREISSIACRNENAPVPLLIFAGFALIASAGLLWGESLLDNGRIEKTVIVVTLLLAAGCWKLRRRRVVELVTQGEKIIWRSATGSFGNSLPMVRRFVEEARQFDLLILKSDCDSERR